MTFENIFQAVLKEICVMKFQITFWMTFQVIFQMPKITSVEDMYTVISVNFNDIVLNP